MERLPEGTLDMHPHIQRKMGGNPAQKRIEQAVFVKDFPLNLNKNHTTGKINGHGFIGIVCNHSPDFRFPDMPIAADPRQNHPLSLV